MNRNKNAIMKAIDLLNEFELQAAIFDLDGTLLDNNYYHRISWIAYLKNAGRNITEEEFNENMNGRTNHDAVQYIFGKDLSEEKITNITLEKEAVYREMYAQYIKPVPGLINLLEFFRNKGLLMAIATSGIQPNIDFMFDHVPIKPYFKAVINSAHITNGKPDPEIYLKTASTLNVQPEHCLVFEDAVVGIEAAKSAGMKVVAVATTEDKKELSNADLIIDDYRELMEN
ncbi:MAG: HAD family phosphatase [Chitinophagaceae bacterium]|nr:HAD family phosphatase [Chitinophagaceae bacterium]